uniref:50S ribosomal protein L19-1 n=1 Tax=Rhizophora mucronata TaxID=61149 RepID=A0A2P2JNM9_RHIMU
MASKILAQALVAIPRIPAQLPPSRKLKLSPCSTVNSNFRVSLPSGVSWGLIGPNLDAVTAAFARQSFVARAEQEAGGGEVMEEGGETGGVAEESETVVEEGAVAVLEGEEVKVENAAKAPRNRKPRIKLGEIMGVIHWTYFFLLFFFNGLVV